MREEVRAVRMACVGLLQRLQDIYMRMISTCACCEEGLRTASEGYLAAAGRYPTATRPIQTAARTRRRTHVTAARPVARRQWPCRPPRSHKHNCCCCRPWPRGQGTGSPPSPSKAAMIPGQCWRRHRRHMTAPAQGRRLHPAARQPAGHAEGRQRLERGEGACYCTHPRLARWLLLRRRLLRLLRLLRLQWLQWQSWRRITTRA